MLGLKTNKVIKIQCKTEWGKLKRLYIKASSNCKYDKAMTNMNLQCIKMYKYKANNLIMPEF